MRQHADRMISQSPRLDPSFTGIPSFCRFPVTGPEDLIDADVAISGAPVDVTTQYQPCARFGPRDIRDSSMLFPIGLHGVHDPERNETFPGRSWRIVDAGDAYLVHGVLTQNLESIRSGVRRIAEVGAMPVSLGGDRGITVPVLETLAPLGPFAVIRIDAHLDFVDSRCRQRCGQSSPLRRASQMSHASGTAQLGIRGPSSSSRSSFAGARAAGNLILSPRDIRTRGVEAVVASLPDADRYCVTIDIDGMDTSIAPDTGTPSPGGLLFDETVELLEGVASRAEIIGMDTVEVAPDRDPISTATQLSARSIIDLLGFALKARQDGTMNMALTAENG